MIISKNSIFIILISISACIIFMGCDSLNSPSGQDGDSIIADQRSGNQAVMKNPARNVCNNMQEAWIFCDDFESDEPLSERYFEYTRPETFTRVEGAGKAGGAAMRARFHEGVVAAGGFKKSFGRTPDDYIGNHAVEPDKDFDEIYWRFDLKLQEGWIGGGGHKLVRAMTLANSNWAQGTIAHLWSSGENHHYLGMDPASGIDPEGNLVNAWGGPVEGAPYVWPTSNHGVGIDLQDNIWIGGNGQGDSHVLVFTRGGEFIRQIGIPRQGRNSNALDHFSMVAKVAFDLPNNEAYLADG
jgi:hypothetical protein